MNIKALSPHAVVPSRGSKHSAGYDLYFAAPEDESLTIEPHTTKLVPTGWAMEIGVGKFGAIFARSGLASKKGLRPANCVGVIDSDYRGEVMVALHNDTEVPVTIYGKERIAQLIIMDYYFVAEFKVVPELSDTSRGEGGFGSTGNR